MSANNYILIKKLSLGVFEVSERDFDTESEINSIGTFKTLQIAVNKSEKYITDSEWGIEYGIRFKLNNAIGKVNKRNRY